MKAMNESDRDDRVGVMVVGVCMLASVAALALWFSTELSASQAGSVAGSPRTRGAETTWRQAPGPGSGPPAQLADLQS